MKLQHDNPFFSFMDKIGDFIALNLLFILSCIPIVTIGASCCALYGTLKKRLHDEERSIFYDYVIYFRTNFKNATLLFLFYSVIFSLLLYYSHYIAKGNSTIIEIVGYLFLFLYFTFSMLYCFPLQTTFLNTPWNLIKNSFFTAFLHLPNTILLFFLTYLPIVITWLYPNLFPITCLYWVTIGFSINCIISISITTPIFNKYKS